MPTVEAIFDRESLISTETLAVLLERNDHASARRLFAHFGCIAAGLLVATAVYGTPWVVLPTLALAFLLATIFAPYHECTHGTAFATPAYNRWALTLVGVLYGVSWHAYRKFHFQHHAHTQDLQKDPEIMMDPDSLSPWPNTPARWLITLTGARFLASKISAMGACWIPGAKRFAEFPPRVRNESRVISAFWLLVLIAALSGVSGAWPLVVAFVLAHVVEGLWLTTEHSGRAEGGTILERTRTVRSNAFVRFFLWNMNYHAEHHGWLGVPWHALPTLHEHLGEHVDTQRGYVHVYRTARG